MHDLVVRGGTIVDGTGAPPFESDVAVTGGRIVEVGRGLGRAREEVDARDRLVTPGFVDPHTHYDGQVTWDELVTPSIWHGVTTVVTGNCGVGFAPVAPDRRDWLISLMEGVEDIPGPALREGIRWDWETVPEYLDAVDRIPHALDVAVQVPHGAVRTYVMGERGATDADPTPEDLDRMADVVRTAIAAGAVGFSTNRLPLHTGRDGKPVPGTFAGRAELFALGEAMRDASPDAVFSLILPTAMGYDPASWEPELAWMAELSRATGLALSFGFGAATAPGRWSEQERDVLTANRTGARLFPMVGCRRQGVLFGLRTIHPFLGRPEVAALAGLPAAEQAARLAAPELRARVLTGGGPSVRNPDTLFPLRDPHHLEPDPSESIAAIAARTGRRADEVLYDELLADGGTRLVYCIMGGYAEGSLDVHLDMMRSPVTVLGLGDGGAHVSMICDAGYPTFLLRHWTRDRRGDRLELPEAVRMLTGDVAALYGLRDRGLVAAGRRADLNVIDLDRLGLRYPEVVADLPAGARRVIQRADGYAATLVGGQVVQRDGEDTGARPGGVVRRP